MTLESTTIGGVELRVNRTGAGNDVLFLHGEDALLRSERFLVALGDHADVLAPLAPGWGSPRPAHVRSIGDLAYMYLDVIESLDRPPVLVGASLGAWLAAEIAVRSDRDLAGLVLVAPVGIKTGGRRTRTFVDLWATGDRDLAAALYADPSAAPTLADLDDEQLFELATAQEAVARFAWEPYLHNPQLLHRLHRIDVATLIVVGTHDRFVLDGSYGETYAAAIGPNASVTRLPGGHRLEEEAPDELAETIAGFVGARDRSALGRQGLSHV